MLNPTVKIKIAMLKKGISGAEIARRAGVSRAAICLAIQGKIRSEKLRKEISRSLNLPFSIWEEMKKRRAA